jgi:SRSO17 transposase
MPGEGAWLIGVWRSSGERKYYLSNLPAKANLKKLAAAIKARWVCEQAHQQMKEELGLDHFVGRSWQGLHRHALLTMIAYAFLQQQRLEQAKREKKNPSRTAAPNSAGCPTRRHQGTIAKANPRTMSPLSKYQKSMEIILPK